MPLISFLLDGKWVLLASPTDMLPQGFEYHNGNGSLCLIGTYDEQTKTFHEEHDQAIDYGIDFSCITDDARSLNGRRIMVGWMQNWDTCTLRSPEDAMDWPDESAKRAVHPKWQALSGSGAGTGRNAVQQGCARKGFRLQVQSALQAYRDGGALTWS